MKLSGNQKERVSVTVRIPEHILKQVDVSVDRGDVPVSRNHWIIEALVEKLRRADTAGESNGTR